MNHHFNQLNQLQKLSPELADQARLGEITPAEGLKRVLAGMQPPFDLVIAYRKFGRGSTSNQDDPIVWYKIAGQKKIVPQGKMTMGDVGRWTV